MDNLMIKSNIHRPRRFTSALMEAVDDGLINKDILIQSLLCYMSEADVKDFVEREDYEYSVRDYL